MGRVNVDGMTRSRASSSTSSGLFGLSSSSGLLRLSSSGLLGLSSSGVSRSTEPESAREALQYIGRVS